LATAWGVLLGRVTGRSDIVFGHTVSGRGLDLPGIDAIAGLLINTVPARVRWTGGDPLADRRRGFAARPGEGDRRRHPRGGAAWLRGQPAGSGRARADRAGRGAAPARPARTVRHPR